MQNIIYISPALPVRPMPHPIQALSPAPLTPNRSDQDAKGQRPLKLFSRRVFGTVTNHNARCSLSPSETEGSTSFLAFSQPPSQAHVNKIEEDESDFDFPPTTLHGDKISSPHSLAPGPFEYVKQLQTGGFAETIVVREQNLQGKSSNRSGRFFCLKVFNKRAILEENLLYNVIGELLAYKQLSWSNRNQGSTFVMSLEASLLDQERLYFVMELMCCDLLAVMRDSTLQRRHNARRWLAQMAIGISAVHAAGIIHRDIKPENILIDCRNNVRITDFGSAYANYTGTALHPWGEYCDDVAGTWEYMAPELLLNRSKTVCERRKYGVAVDYWGLGCVAYELEADISDILFPTEEEKVRFFEWNISSNGGESYFADAELTEHAESLITGLLRVSAADRYGFKQLRQHPYFEDENGLNEFEDIEYRALQRTYIPFQSPESVEKNKTQKIIISANADFQVDPQPLDRNTFENLGWINAKGIWGYDCSFLFQPCKW